MSSYGFTIAILVGIYAAICWRVSIEISREEQ